jgi:transposase
LVLSAEERKTLENWARRPKTAQATALRARLILGCAAGKTNTLVARELRVTKQTVGKWRSRFVTTRLDGLLDEPRPGAPRTVTDAAIERVVTLTLETTPRDATHWSTRAMARQCGLSQSTVSRIWRAFSLQPHRSETFKLSPDPLFIDKVRDIVGLYLNPPDKALVLCVDEKAQIQALDRSQPLLPMRPGQVERRTHDYRRHGTTSLFAAFDTQSGRVIGQRHRRHRAIEFRKFLSAPSTRAVTSTPGGEPGPDPRWPPCLHSLPQQSPESAPPTFPTSASVGAHRFGASIRCSRCYGPRGCSPSCADPT